MQPIDNIRRDIREASYLKYSPVPFAGAVHDFTKPLRKRFEQRQYTGPYYYSPAKPGGGRGFYMGAGMYCDKHGSTFDLRLEDANDHLSNSRLSNVNGYYCDDDGDGDTLQPIVARLPHGRGFLAGWTMGAGMCAAIDLDIFDTIEDAARAAHSKAEYDAEESRDANAREREENNAEENSDD